MFESEGDFNVHESETYAAISNRFDRAVDFVRVNRRTPSILASNKEILYE